MSDENQVVTGVVIGAMLGAAAAYLVFTAHGRRTLDTMDAALDDVSAALDKFRHALQRTDGIVHEARGAVDDIRAMLQGEDLPQRV